MGNWAAVAKAVNDRMAERGITQRELAEQSGVSTATLRQIQQGVDRKRSTVTLAAISRALGLPDDHLRRVSADEGLRANTSVEDVRAEVAELRRRVDAIEERLPLGRSDS